MSEQSVPLCEPNQAPLPNRFKMTPLDLMQAKQSSEVRKPPAVRRRGSNYIPSTTTDLKKPQLGGSNSAIRAAKRLGSSTKRGSIRGQSGASKESFGTKLSLIHI